MEVFKNVIKKERAKDEVLTFQPRAIELGLTDSAKVYLNEENRKKSDFVLSDLIAKQTGVADVRSESYKSLVEEEVLKRLQEIQEGAYKEAYALGQEEGAKAAFESVKGELEQKFSELNQLVDEVRSLRSQILHNHERELIELVFQIGKKIAIKELSEDSSVVKELLETLLLEFEKDQEIKVSLSTSDYEFISKQIQSGVFKLSDGAKVKFNIDEKMTNGGCRIQTEFGSIDLQVEQRVESAWKALKSRMPKSEENKS